MVIACLMAVVQLNGQSAALDSAKTCFSQSKFKESKPFDGVNYYRVRAIHEYNTQMISQVQKVEFTDFDFDFELYPNPSNGIVNIALSKGANDSRLEVINSLGEAVKRTDHAIGQKRFELSSGAYFVRITKDSMTKVKSLVVTR